MWRISNKLGASKNMFKQDLQKDWESELLISLYHILNKVQFVSDIFWVNCDDGEVSCCSTRVVRCWSYYRLVCQDFSQCPPRVESHTAISRYIEDQPPIVGRYDKFFPNFPTSEFEYIRGREVASGLLWVKLCKFHPLLHLQYTRWLPGAATPLQHPSRQ